MKKFIYLWILVLMISVVYSESMSIESPSYDYGKLVTLYTIPRCSGKVMIKVTDKTTLKKYYPKEYGYKINRCVLIQNKTITNSRNQIWQCECNGKFDFQVIVNNVLKQKVYDYYIDYYLTYDINKSLDANDAYKRSIKLKDIKFVKPKQSFNLFKFDTGSFMNIIVGVGLLVLFVVVWFYKWVKDSINEEEKEEEKDDFLF